MSPQDLAVNYLVSRTRGNGSRLIVNRPKIGVTAENFVFRIPKQWNRLPSSLRICDSHNYLIFHLRNNLF